MEGRSRRWGSIAKAALKELALLDAADRLDDLRAPDRTGKQTEVKVPPGHARHGRRAEQLVDVFPGL